MEANVHGAPKALNFFYGAIAPIGPCPPHYRGFTITKPLSDSLI